MGQKLDLPTIEKSCKFGKLLADFGCNVTARWLHCVAKEKREILCKREKEKKSI
jgi:hypothetical protein